LRDYTNADIGPGEIDAKIISLGKIAETNKCRLRIEELNVAGFELREFKFRHFSSL